MTEHSRIRREKAEEINAKISDLATAVLLVGSTAYNPNAVTAESDLDLVGILDFPTVDFEELYSRLGQQYEPLVAQYASEAAINTFSITWDETDFEVGLHLWDTVAFNNVVELQWHNKIFARTNSIRYFKSTSTDEIFRNLRGGEKVLNKPPEKVSGGTILPFYPYIEDKSDFYIGIQVNNLLMDPIILSEKGTPISDGLIAFEENLRAKLDKKYGAAHDGNINLYNSLPERLQSKVSTDLRKRLESFF